MFYTAAWCSNSEETFKRSIPFELLAESIKRYGSTIPFNIVFLEGIELLSDAYLNTLRSLGFILIDYCDNFKKIVSRYPAIDRFHSRYERNCFLRWIAFDEIRRAAGGNAQFWHLDSDVILHTSLDSLAEDTRGKTFMLQGCPVFVSISDDSWFKAYQQELKKLESDILGYSQAAAQQKEECRTNDIMLANESCYRYPIGHDQDLLEYMVSSRKILQETSAKIYDSKYYYIQNPLSIKKWHSSQVDGASVFEEGADFTIHIGTKSVPFTHYQNTFSSYAGLYCFQKRMHFPEFLIRRVSRFRITETAFQTGILYKVLMKIKTWYDGTSREDTIRMLMHNRAANQKSLLVNLLNLLKSE